MKDFLKVCKPNKMDKNELAYLIYEHQGEIIEFYIKKNHIQKFNDVFAELYKKMNSKKFVKALKLILKDDEMSLDCGFAVVIAAFIAKTCSNEDASAEIMEEYKAIINKLLKKRVKEIKSKTDIDPEVITELLIIAPSRDYISDDKFVGIYSQKMLKKLYYMASNKELNIENTKQIKKLFKAIFGKELIDLIAINILLEKKETLKNMNEKQIEIWNLMTTFALEVIESQKKGHIIELLEYYCRRRFNDTKKQNDAARRIQLKSINAEQYPVTSKAVNKMAKSNKFEPYL